MAANMWILSKTMSGNIYSILKTLCSPCGKCRVMFSTIVFGIGVDVPNVQTIIYKCERAGRDGEPSNVVLHVYPG